MAGESSEPPDEGGYRFVWPPTREEWPTFYRYWRGVILRVCASRGLDPHTAEDVVQHVMKSLNGGAGGAGKTFANISALGGYVTTAARRLVVRMREKALRHRPIVAEDAIPDHPQRDRFVTELVDLIPTDVSATERFAWLLEQVSQQNRELFRLKYALDLQWKEISDTLGVPVTTLIGRHKSELDALRRRLNRDAT
jgi:DNA-directed RNA polymerase specialized sigma24 family protein